MNETQLGLVIGLVVWTVVNALWSAENWAFFKRMIDGAKFNVKSAKDNLAVAERLEMTERVLNEREAAIKAMVEVKR